MGNEPMILMYHSVAPYTADPYRITVRPERFARQLRWMRRRGLRGVSVRELLAARTAGTAAGLVGLTFDDGYADFTTEVLPLLRASGYTATVYVVAGALGGVNGWDTPGPRKPLMTADDVRRAAVAGMEIGSHSLRHPRLPGLAEPTAAEEIGGSRDVLRRIVGDVVDGFCYPYGAAGDREIGLVRDAGYAYGCAVSPIGRARPHALPRVYVGDRDSAPRLYAKWLRHRLQTAGRSVTGRSVTVHDGGA